MAKRTKSNGSGAGYRCLRGINWPNPAGGEFAAEPGDVRTDLPTQYVGEWIAIGAIEPADTGGDEPVVAEEEGVSL